MRMSLRALSEPLIRKNATSATSAIVRSVPPPDLILVKEREVNNEIRSDTTIDGVQKSVEYLSEPPLSLVSLLSLDGLF